VLGGCAAATPDAQVRGGATPIRAVLAEGMPFRCLSGWRERGTAHPAAAGMAWGWGSGWSLPAGAAHALPGARPIRDAGIPASVRGAAIACRKVTTA